MTPISMAVMIELIFERVQTLSHQAKEATRLVALFQEDVRANSKWVGERDLEREQNMMVAVDKLCTITSDLVLADPQQYNDEDQAKSTKILEYLRDIRKSINETPLVNYVDVV